jgi:hypothetical protein
MLCLLVLLYLVLLGLSLSVSISLGIMLLCRLLYFSVLLVDYYTAYYVRSGLRLLGPDQIIDLIKVAYLAHFRLLVFFVDSLNAC